MGNLPTYKAAVVKFPTKEAIMARSLPRPFSPVPSLAMVGRGLVVALALAMPVAAASVADLVRPALSAR
ncbi:hypothetical protein Mnod_6700 [Methylobacterium nodulans ORS 2060]|uniref:Uncharacterized protein n=1 Tax=Methylobacterium nodulans (strain LMG 21967 / CNCM I-2342 / ORS 2060) TaxID=460265 RepID=B8IEW8_METNO|nr:hypothetical protein Mnod_6700 [Methylobacterium nodulans ORS 2060]